jgi:catechol 2,3-dioxygenase
VIATRLAHVALTVPDPEAAARFYGEILGLAPIGEGEAIHLAGGRTRTFELVLIPGEPGLDHFAFAVADAAALDAAREAIDTAEPVEVESALGLTDGIAFPLPTGHVMELVLEEDPSGYVPASSAHPRHHRGVGPVAIEHVTLLADDIEANARFLTERLGFRITDSVQPAGGPWRNTHLRAGELHHDLAMLPGSGDGPELHHFCFAVPSVADLVRLSDALAARGMALDASMGRHVAGNNVFLYFRDPFGIRLEVNTDMARIDPAAPPNVIPEPVPFDAWREGRPPALASGTRARDGRVGTTA